MRSLEDIFRTGGVEPTDLSCSELMVLRNSNFFVSVVCEHEPDWRSNSSNYGDFYGWVIPFDENIEIFEDLGMSDLGRKIIYENEGVLRRCILIIWSESLSVVAFHAVDPNDSFEDTLMKYIFRSRIASLSNPDSREKNRHLLDTILEQIDPKEETELKYV